MTNAALSAEAKLVQITLDGREVSAAEGRPLLEVALEAGIDIPRLCHDWRLKPAGRCGLCLVETEGQAEPVRACETQVAAGQSVRTSSCCPQISSRPLLSRKEKDHFHPD